MIDDRENIYTAAKGLVCKQSSIELEQSKEELEEILENVL